MMTAADLSARVRRLEELTRGLAKEVLRWKECNDPLLYVERKAYLDGMQNALAGLDDSRVALGEPAAAAGRGRCDRRGPVNGKGGYEGTNRAVGFAAAAAVQAPRFSGPVSLGCRGKDGSSASPIPRGCRCHPKHNRFTKRRWPCRKPSGRCSWNA